MILDHKHLGDAAAVHEPQQHHVGVAGGEAPDQVQHADQEIEHDNAGAVAQLQQQEAPVQRLVHVGVREEDCLETDQGRYARSVASNWLSQPDESMKGLMTEFANLAFSSCRYSHAHATGVCGAHLRHSRHEPCAHRVKT